MKKIAPILMLSLAAGHASAAIVLTDFTTFTENFNGFNDGTAAKVPANFTAFHQTSPAFNGRILTSGTSPYNTATGFYSLNDNGTPTDFTFGARTNVSSGFGTLTFDVTNSTGATIPGIAFTYDFKQFSTAGGQSDLNFRGSTDGTTFNIANLSGDTTTSVTTGGSSDTVFADPIVAAKTASWSSPIANGATVSLRFEWLPVSGGFRPHFGVDNLTVTAIPEPSAALLSAFGVLALAARRRRAN